MGSGISIPETGYGGIAMKKKILALVLAIALICVFAGCSKPVIIPPETVVTEALDAVKNLDETKMKEIWGMGVLSEALDGVEMNEEELLDFATKYFEYNIISTEEDGNSATVKAEITNVDGSTFFGNIMSTAIIELMAYAAEHDGSYPPIEETNARLLELLNEALKQEEQPTATYTVDIPLTLEDNVWKIQSSEKILTAILGGIYDYDDGTDTASD